MSLAEKIVAVLLVLLTIALGVLYIRGLSVELAGRTQQLDEARQSIADRDGTIKHLQVNATDKARQQEQLDRSRASIASQLADVQQENRRLRDENAAIREWADTPLPADIARLHDIPAQTGAHDHAAAVPNRAALHVPGDGAAH